MPRFPLLMSLLVGGALSCSRGAVAAPRSLSPVIPASPSAARKSPQIPAKTEPFRLIVPSIGLDIPVMPDIDLDSLRSGPGHDPLSARPGEAGNCVIASHRNVHGAYFWYLPKVMRGAMLTLQTPREYVDFKVDFVGVVSESRTDLLENAGEMGAAPRLTLYTCTLPVSKNRFVVTARFLTRRSASPDEMVRPTVVPEIVSGPLFLLKDKVLKARAQARLKALKTRQASAR